MTGSNKSLISIRGENQVVHAVETNTTKKNTWKWEISFTSLIRGQPTEDSQLHLSETFKFRRR